MSDKNMGIDDDDLRSIIPFMKKAFKLTISLTSYMVIVVTFVVTEHLSELEKIRPKIKH